MEFVAKIKKFGNSFHVIIPIEIIRHLNLKEEDSEIFEIKKS